MERIPRTCKGIVTCFGVVLSLFSPPPVLAQYGDGPPPVRSAVDGNGVNAIDGSFVLNETQVVIGQTGRGGLARVYYGGPGELPFYARDSLTGTINFSAPFFTVTLGATSRTYYQNVDRFAVAAEQGDGSTLRKVDSTTYRWVMRDGTVGIFSTVFRDQFGRDANTARLTSLTLPNGEVRTYHYIPVRIAAGTGARIEAVTNNFGYAIKYLYQTTRTNTNSDVYLSKVIGLNYAVEYCQPTADSCPGLTVSWPSVTIDPANHRRFVDNLGRVTIYPEVRTGTTEWVKPSGETITIVSDSSRRVTSISNGTGTWTYSYPGTGLTSIQDPIGNVRVVAYDVDTQLVSYEHGPDLHKTEYTYDSAGRLVGILRPGLSVMYTYDVRGNLTNTLVTGNNTATLSTSASFDADCTVPAKCNQPNWTEDARGNRTNYTYWPATGQLRSVVRPAGANGLRPQTHYEYTSLYAWYRDHLNSVVSAPTPVSMLTRVSRCATAETCDGANGSEQTVISYGAGGVGNNRLPVSVAVTGVTSAFGTESATTSFSYDEVGNPRTETDALGRLTRFRYDAGRRLIGIIGPDADGAGPLGNRALRISYRCDASVKAGCDDFVTLSEQGTTDGHSDAAWAAFARLIQVETIYDGLNRKSLEAASDGLNYSRVHQFSYDAANRLICEAVRMNPDAIGSRPSSACQLGAQGVHGPDRVTRYSYDPMNRLSAVRAAVGTLDLPRFRGRVVDSVA